MVISNTVCQAALSKLLSQSCFDATNEILEKIKCNVGIYALRSRDPLRSGTTSIQVLGKRKREFDDVTLSVKETKLCTMDEFSM